MSSAPYPLQTYNGTEEFVVSIDIGNTQSAVSFVHLVSGKLPQIRTVSRWPGQAPSEDTAKTPTVVSYQKGAVKNCGEGAMSDLEGNSGNVARWFKMHIHPPTMPRPSHFEIPNMPPGVSAHRAYLDMIKYLMDSTKRFFEKTTPNGHETWARLRYKMIIILTTPNGWDPQEQTAVRKVAVDAKIVTREDADLLIRFMNEAEAAVHCALARYRKRWLEKDTVFSVIDVGGSTVDVTVYKCKSTSPLELLAVCPNECVQAGGIFVNREVEKLLHDRLRGSAYDDAEIIRDILNSFEKELIPQFDGSESSYQIKFGPDNYHEGGLGINKGTINFSTNELTQAFDIAVNPIIDYCTRALRSHRPKYILLVGGFGESPYLQKALAKTFAARGTQVILERGYSRKATAEGAAIGYTKELSDSRKPIGEDAILGRSTESLEPTVKHGWLCMPW